MRAAQATQPGGGAPGPNRPHACQCRLHAAATGLLPPTDAASLLLRVKWLKRKVEAIPRTGVQTMHPEPGSPVGVPRLPLSKFSRTVRSFQTPGREATVPAAASGQLRRCPRLADAERASSGPAEGRGFGARGGPSARAARPGDQGRGPANPRRGAGGARGPWGLGRGGARGGGGGRRGGTRRRPPPPEVRPRAGPGAQGGEAAAAPRPSPGPERVWQAARRRGLLCLRVGSGASADLRLRGRCEAARARRPPARLPGSGSSGGGERVGGGGGALVRTCRPRAGGRPQAELPAAPAEPRRPPHAARAPRGLVLLPNFAKSARAPAALGRASARRLASPPQRPREEEEEPPPPHQRDRIPAAWGGVMLRGL